MRMSKFAFQMNKMDEWMNDQMKEMMSQLIASL